MKFYYYQYNTFLKLGFYTFVFFFIFSAWLCFYNTIIYDGGPIEVLGFCFFIGILVLNITFVIEHKDDRSVVSFYFFNYVFSQYKILNSEERNDGLRVYLYCTSSSNESSEILFESDARAMCILSFFIKRNL